MDAERIFYGNRKKNQGTADVERAEKNRTALQTVDLPITNTQVDMMFAFVEVVYILKYQIMARLRQKRAQELNIKYDAVVS